jgi:predicted ATP-grasp superfamily ATP-dependent carboligase
MKQKVIVIGNSFTSRLGIIRSVAQIGCEVIVIAIANWKKGRYRKPIDCYSKYVSTIHYFNRQDGEEGLVRLLLDECVDESQKVILIPDSDFSAMTIDKHLNQLKEHFLFPNIHEQEGMVVHWMNKMCQKDLARTIGITVPNAIILENENGVFHVAQGINYPCFTKPLSSIGGGKNCLKRCDNSSELQEVLDLATKNKIPKLLVEDYIEIEKEYATLGFSDGKNVVIPGIIQFIEGCQTYPGIALLGKVMPIKGFEGLVELFVRFVRQIGYVGIFDIDFFESKGDYYFGELNLRFGGSGYAFTKMGSNLPGMFVNYLQNLDFSEMKRQIEDSAFYVNERMCMSDWDAGLISMKQCHEKISSASITFVNDKDDTGPQRAMKKELVRMRIKKAIKRIKNH